MPKHKLGREVPSQLCTSNVACQIDTSVRNRWASEHDRIARCTPADGSTSATSYTKRLNYFRALR
jgi:hypothetical protein